MRSETLLERLRAAPPPVAVRPVPHRGASALAGTLAGITRLPTRAAATDLVFGIRPLGADRRVTFDRLAALGWTPETSLAHRRVGAWIVLSAAPADGAGSSRRDVASVDSKGRLRVPAAFEHLLGGEHAAEVLIRIDPSNGTAALAPASVLAAFFADLDPAANSVAGDTHMEPG